jgi:RNA polymerase sigma-70 factor (sigma-E family)
MGEEVRVRDDVEFERFAAAQLSGLLRPAYYLTGDMDLAQDLVQATLVKMYGAWGRLRPDVDRVAYARTVLLNVYRDHTRGERRLRNTLLRKASQPAYAADVDIAERDYHRELLLQLAPKQRAVVVLRFLEDLSVQETADCLGVTVGTVKSQTADALRALRTAIAGVGGAHE